MSDQAMKDAQYNQAVQENGQLKATLQNISAQARAMKQCLDEYLNANIGLRTSQILMEEAVGRMQGQIQSLNERCRVLEIEKSNLMAKVDELGKPAIIENETVLDGNAA